MSGAATAFRSKNEVPGAFPDRSLDTHLRRMQLFEKNPAPSPMAYRRDLDGVRALAVLAVVAAHAKLPWLDGGYVGVDVFFVLSGYLITSIIARDIELGRFSFASFYERRARRLLPALFFMLGAISVAGLWLFPPWQFEHMAKTMAATAVFASNIQLMIATGDYFSSGAETQPLLHTWSLAVEEQFYFFFPPLLLIAYRFSRRIAVWALSILCLVSFFLASATVYTHQPDAFFLPHLRAWEMGAGALLAMLVLPRITSVRMASLLGLAGLGMIIACILLYDAETIFPGIAAAPVVLGTLLIIYSGQTTGGAAARLLSAAPTVAVGKISYSLYLWHWPPIVAVQTYGGGEAEPWLMVCAIGFAIFAGWASWRFIEDPFRGKEGNERFSKRQVFRMAAIGTGLILLVATAAVKTDGIADRLPEGVQATYAEARRMADLDRACRTADIRDEKTFCRLGASSAVFAPSVLIWGDSHAGAWLPGMDAWLEAEGLTGSAMIRSGCPPLLKLERIGTSSGLECRKWNDEVMAWIEKADIETVILAGRWSISYHGSRVGREPGDPVDVSWSDGIHTVRGVEAFERALSQSLQALRQTGVATWVVGNVPEIGWDVPQRFIDQAFFSGEISLPSPLASTVSDRLEPVDMMIQNIARMNGASFFPVYGSLCEEACKVTDNGKLIYRDDDHLSPYGARTFFPKVLASTPYQK